MNILLGRGLSYCFVSIMALAAASTVHAGNVRATLSGGNLYLYGDSTSNSLLVTSPEPGTIVVTGMTEGGEATTVNGTEEPVELSGWNGGVFAYLYDGNDFLIISNADVKGTVHVDLGPGNDGLELSPAIEVMLDDVGAALVLRQNLLVLGGSGDDHVYLGDAVVHGSATFDLGNGSDALELGNGIVDESGATTQFLKSLVIVPGPGDDLTDLWGVDIALDTTIDDPSGSAEVYLDLVSVDRNLFLFTSNQADVITLVDLTIRDLFKLIAKDGLDDIVVDFLQADRFEFYLGAGDDLISMSNLDLNRMWAYLEGGNDSSSLSSSQVERLYLYGGAGNDEIDLLDTNGTEANIYGEGGTDTLNASGNSYPTLRVYSVENRP